MMEATDRLINIIEDRRSLDDALHIVKIHHLVALIPAHRMAAACDQTSQPDHLIRLLRDRQRLRIKYRSHIKNPDIRILAGEIADGIFHNTRKQTRTNQRIFIGQRVHDRDGPAQFTVRRNAHFIQHIRIGKAERQLLRHAKASQHMLNTVDEIPARALTALHHASKRCG